MSFSGKIELEFEKMEVFPNDLYIAVEFFKNPN